MKSRLRRSAVNIGLALVSVAIAAALLETVLHHTSYVNVLPGRKLDSFREHLQSDPLRGYDLKKNSPRMPAFVDGVRYDVWTNELGCFDLPYTGERDPILLIGDSFTFAFAPFEDKWGTRLQETLGRRVLKCGVGGYGTEQELLKAAELLPRLNHPPKLIVVGYFINDLEDDYLFPQSTVLDGYPVRTRFIRSGETGEIVTRDLTQLRKEQGFRMRGYPNALLLKKLKQWLEGRSVMYIMTRNSLKSLVISLPFVKQAALKAKLVMPPTIAFSDKPWVSRAWAVHFGNLAALKRLAVDCGGTLLVVIIPYKEQVYPFLGNDVPEADMDRPQRVLREFFDREAIRHIDLLPLLKASAAQTRHFLDVEKDLYWRMDQHLNVRGNRLVGLLVSRYILKNDLLGTDRKEERLAAVGAALERFPDPR